MNESNAQRVNLGGPLILNEEDRALLDRIVAPAAPRDNNGIVINEGYRYLALGRTGSGKTGLMRAVVYYTISLGYARFALVHDTKSMFLPEYPRSVQVANVQEWISRGGFRKGDIPVVSFRGDPRRDIIVSADEVASVSLELGRKGRVINGVWNLNPHVTVIDELAAATTKSGKQLLGTSISKLATEGRKLGVSLVGTTQRPKRAPEDILTQADAISFGTLEPYEVNYLEGVLQLDPAICSALRGPTNEGLPKHQFILRISGEPWDGQIHKLSARTVTMFE